MQSKLRAARELICFIFDLGESCVGTCMCRRYVGHYVLHPPRPFQAIDHEYSNANGLDGIDLGLRKGRKQPTFGMHLCY